jgi:hypothetical protein
MERFTSWDLMVSVLPESSAGGDSAECVTACTNEPTRQADCATACTNEPTKPEAWSDLATDDDLALLQGDLARALS